MPDAAGNIKGIVLSGKAGEVLERIKRQEALDEISAIGQEQKCECKCHDPQWIGTPGCWCPC